MVGSWWRRFSLFALCISPFSQAQPIFEPLWVENLSPLAALVALPSQRSADIREGVSVSLHSDVATHLFHKWTVTKVSFLMAKLSVTV